MPPADSDSFETLIAPWLGRLLGAAYRLTGNAPDAEDLVQDTCVLAGEKIDALRSAHYPDRWLFRVLYNRFVDGVRRRNRSPVVTCPAGGDAADAQGLDSAAGDPAEETDSERAFLLACAKLSKSHRAILSLRAEGYGLAEIEDITGIGRDVLKARLQRARVSLARHLRNEEEAEEIPGRLGSSR